MTEIKDNRVKNGQESKQQIKKYWQQTKDFEMWTDNWIYIKNVQSGTEMTKCK